MAILRDPNSSAGMSPLSTVREDGWIEGMNNIAKDTAIPDKQVRYAQNVDIDNQGNLYRRKGQVAVVNSTQIHSFWAGSTTAYFVDGTSLKSIDNTDTVSTIVTGLTVGASVSYVEVNDEVYWSNGVQSGIIWNGTNRAWGIPNAGFPVVLAVTGSIPAGTYQIGMTYVTSTGEEGGCPGTTAITLSTTAGIRITNIPTVAPNSDIVAVRIYATATNGDVEYWQDDVSFGSATFTMTSLRTNSTTMNSAGLDAFPPCVNLTYSQGRIYGSQGSVVWMTDPMRYQLYDPTKDFILYATNVQMVAGVQDGVFVSDTKNTYFYTSDGEQSQQKVVLPYAAMPNTVVAIPNEYKVAWFSARGWVIGANGGAAENQMETRVLPGTATTSCASYVESSGLRQLVAIINQTADHPLAVI